MREYRPTRKRGARPGKAAARGGRKRAAAETIAGVRLTHPGRVLYPEIGLTKRDLAAYFAAVAAQMLPHARDRPLSLVRCPEGRARPCFFQRRAMAGMPGAIGRLPVRMKQGMADYTAVSSAAGLVACAQIGALELHIWGARKDDIERPDRLVLDLDPAPDVPFAQVRAAAAQIAELLAGAGLAAFPLVTGGKGVHLVIPLRRRQEWPAVAAFARGLAERLAARDPARFVATMSKAKRKGRIFIDHFRNTRSASAIAPWSPRAKDRAPVAMPVDWPELARLERADAFTLSDALARIESGKGPWAGYFKTRQSLTAKTAAALGIDLAL